MGEFSLTTKGFGSWESFLLLPRDGDRGRVFSHYQRNGDHMRVFSHYQRTGIMGEFSVNTKGWGSCESFLSLPKDGDRGRVFSHYQRIGIMGEFSLNIKGW